MNIDLKLTNYTNISQSVKNKLDSNLHNLDNHPINICKEYIYEYFRSLSENNTYEQFTMFDKLDPIVTTDQNFDKLLIEKNHPARSKSDTYYVSEDLVLRTHTSAHQHTLLTEGYNNFLVTGDVYRKDEVNSTHYYVFHQMEGLAKVQDGKDPIEELKEVLSGLVKHLFPGCEYRFNKDYFPFTDPSLEIEVMYNGNWLEILGCGVTQPKIIESSNRNGTWWAFGLGLERISMILFDIKDIRYFWSKDQRFFDQFKENKIVKFKAFSNLESEIKDISFWINSGLDEDNKWDKENDFFEIIRDDCGDWVEFTDLIDSFTNKNGRHSKCYRVKFLPIDTEHLDPNHFKQTCIKMMNSVTEKIKKFDIEIRG